MEDLFANINIQAQIESVTQASNNNGLDMSSVSNLNLIEELSFTTSSVPLASSNTKIDKNSILALYSSVNVQKPQMATSQSFQQTFNQPQQVNKANNFQQGFPVQQSQNHNFANGNHHNHSQQTFNYNQQQNQFASLLSMDNVRNNNFGLFFWVLKIL